uniref:Alpha/beta hydrolase fold-3 domain-containing protein n=1 Tax=Ananas comosus var. bracteatus TaxID=296719 RepID=A0A6V7PHX2_ANACO|nr:unnamed protein product [Ananas comosus var. bracteatus]
MDDVGDSAAALTPSKSSNIFLQIVEHLDGTISRPFFPTTSASASSKDVPLNPAHNTWLRLYLPHEGDAAEEEEGKLLPIILYFHGGGFVLFGADSAIYDSPCAAMAASVPALVVSLHYRLAPEHRLPAAYDDALDALLWLRSQPTAAAAPEPWIARRGDFSRCFVMGSSSGANMAYHAALPLLRRAERTASEAASEDDFMLPLRANDMLWRLSLPPGADRDHEFCNPLAAPRPPALRKLPRCFVKGCKGDPLIDRQREFAQFLEGEGVEVVANLDDEGFHAIELFVPAKAEALFAEIREFIYADAALATVGGGGVVESEAS